MAVAPPPPTTANPAPPPPAKRRRGGCGCGGCLGVLLLIVVLVAAAVYFFAIVPASAGAPAPAVLTVYLDRVDVNTGGGFDRGHTGQALVAGNSVRTDAGGRASLAFPDGSISRLAGATSLTLEKENLDTHGALKQATLNQDTGRTYHSVQSLLGGGGHFTVRGHGITADVRGTEFEVLIRPDHSALIKLLKGRLHVSAGGELDLAAGFQVSISAGGQVGAPQPIAPEPADPFAIWMGPAGSESNALNGNQAGTVQTIPSAAPLAAAGQSGDSADYQFPGGDLTAVLGYPGSLMKLDVIGPGGRVVGSAQGPPPVRVTIPSAPAGTYHAHVTGLVLDHGPEPWSVSFASNPPCSLAAAPAATAPGQPVRAMISDAALNTAMAAAGVGVGGVHISPSAGGAIVSGTYSVNGVTVAGTALVFATPPTVDVVLASASLQGINVTAQASSQVAQLSGQAISALRIGFAVDRVYSCRNADGGLLVIEGHGQ